MYKLMIVDDEEIIRNGLVNSINWSMHGYSVVAVAENGKKALEAAKSVKPDIILTDIYMPIMDGIEFTKEVRKLYPEVIVIFLSGYNEFTYAQKAIEVGIFRYLTKPIMEEELLLVLGEASKDLEHKELEKHQISKLKALIRDSLPLLKERFFLNLVKGVFSEREIHNKLDYFGISIEASHFFCMIISMDEYFILSENQSESDLNLLKFAIQNISEEVLSEIGSTVFFFEEKRNEIGVLFCYKDDSETSMLGLLHPVLQKIQDAVRRYLKTTVSIGIGRSCRRLKDISTSYREAEASLEYRTAFGKNSIIYFGDIGEPDKGTIPYAIFEKASELVKAVKSGDEGLSMNIVTDIFESIKQENGLKKAHIHLMVVEIINKFIRVVLEFGADISEVYGDGFTPFTLLNYDTLEDISLKLRELTNRTIEFVNSRHKAVSRNFVEKAKEFINDNYMKEGLNLSKIAENVHVSPGYLSQLFKQVTGESCIEYLTKVRINQAKKLLKETTLKAYEIACRVGYGDSQYFSTCFKRYVGVSPTDYRDFITKDIFE